MSPGSRDGGWRGVEESNAIASWLRERKCKICQESYQGITKNCLKMVIPHFQSVFNGLLVHVINFGDHLPCSIMKHCQDALQRMAMLLIYLLVSWIRQDCMRSKVFPMWLGMYASQLVWPCSPCLCLMGSLCRCNVRCTPPPLKRCVRFSCTERNSLW